MWLLTEEEQNAIWEMIDQSGKSSDRAEQLEPGEMFARAQLRKVVEGLDRLHLLEGSFLHFPYLSDSLQLLRQEALGRKGSQP